MADTYSAVDMSKVDWIVPMVYDEGEDRGFLYTVGLEKHGRPELFIRDVPRMHAVEVGQALNLIGARTTPAAVTDRNLVEANGLSSKGNALAQGGARLHEELLATLAGGGNSSSACAADVIWRPTRLRQGQPVGKRDRSRSHAGGFSFSKPRRRLATGVGSVATRRLERSGPVRTAPTRSA